MYWASIDKPAVKMASLNGTDKVTLLNESKADYTGITLYNNNLYISDSLRRSVFYTVLLGFSHNYNITYMTLATLKKVAVYAGSIWTVNSNKVRYRWKN